MLPIKKEKASTNSRYEFLQLGLRLELKQKNITGHHTIVALEPEHSQRMRHGKRLKNTELGNHALGGINMHLSS
jgi:hypothetical protein